MRERERQCNVKCVTLCICKYNIKTFYDYAGTSPLHRRLKSLFGVFTWTIIVYNHMIMASTASHLETALQCCPF